MSQAARLLGLRTDGLRRWIDGYERRGKIYPPVIRDRTTGVDTVTWGEFVEAGYLREYRAKQVSLRYLRPIGRLRDRLNVRYRSPRSAPTPPAKNWRSRCNRSSASIPSSSS
jgi:hypothetical protein